jgi:hypothetical protein
MPTRITFSIPDGNDSWENLLKKYTGGTGKSTILRDAIQSLSEKITGERECPLPGWRFFEKYLHDANINTVDESLSKAKQLVNIAEREKQWRKGRIKI